MIQWFVTARMILAKLLLLVLMLVLVNPLASLASNPIKQYVLSPAQTGLQYDSLRIRSKDATLTGWQLKGKDLKTILIIAGSDAGNMSYSLPLAAEFVNDLGWSVVLFDYRGFGASDTFTIDPDILAYPEFVDDVKAAVALARKQSPKARIVLWGRSLGAVLAMSAVAEDAKIDELIVESPYLPTQQKFSERMDALRKSAGSDRATTFIKSNRLEPFKLARRIKTRTHYIMGEKETLIKEEDLFKLSDLTKNTRSVFVAKGASHLEFPSKTLDDFPAFLKETIDEKPAKKRK
jgi:uncharacterized protein